MLNNYNIFVIKNKGSTLKQHFNLNDNINT